MTGARPSEISSSSSSLAPVRRMRATASICCSPPDRRVPGLLRRSSRLGNTVVDLVDAHAAAGHLAAAAAGFPRRSGWRRCRALRGSSRCPAARCGAAQADGLVAVEHDRAGAPAHQAHDGRSVVVRPAPLRPSSVTTSPGSPCRSMPCRMCDSPYQACRSVTRSSSTPGVGQPCAPCSSPSLPM
jgi:hypothetical protein